MKESQTQHSSKQLSDYLGGCNMFVAIWTPNSNLFELGIPGKGVLEKC